MCGVFGFVSFNGKGPSMKRLEAIAAVTERRGPHAFGFSWVDSKGRIKMFKSTGKITNALGVLTLARDAVMLIGHCRYATHGAPENNLNNHPFPADGGWYVHNGVISNHEDIIADNHFAPVTECDSEVLGMLIEAGEGRLRQRCVEAVQYASGSPLVMLGLWKTPGRLIALRSGNPLSLGLCKGSAYIASLQEELPGRVVQVPNDSGVDFSTTDMKEFKFTRNVGGAADELGHPVKKAAAKKMKQPTMFPAHPLTEIWTPKLPDLNGRQKRAAQQAELRGMFPPPAKTPGLKPLQAYPNDRDERGLTAFDVAD